MFLIFLNKKNQEFFLELCVHSALTNGVFAEQQMKAMELYCNELNIPAHIPELAHSTKELIDEIASNTSNVEKNIIAVEILSFLISDGHLDQYENSFIDELAKGFQITDKKMSELKKLVEEYSRLSQELFTAVVK